MSDEAVPSGTPPTSSVPIESGLGDVVALRVVRSGRQIALPHAARITIGTHEVCDVRLEDPTISRLHCVLVRDGRELLVIDERSKNGTFLNGQRVERAELRRGAVLKLGHTRLVAVGAMRDERPAMERLRGSSLRFRTAIELALRAAVTNSSVLITGETGTGKELVARAVHEGSPRAGGPWVALNCGAIARELVDSELFGHERGAFTGAVEAREGSFALADGGTLFLDEVGDLSPELQPHLLRVLETRRVRRVGGGVERPIDVRLVAATSRPTNLRADLYHRLAVVVVELPPLRERMEDLRELVLGVLEDLEPEFGARTLSPAAWSALRRHTWPGNVRELRQTLVRALTLGGPELEPDDLFLSRRRGRLARGSVVPTVVESKEGRALSPADQAQRIAMAEALARSSSLRDAAARMGMPKSTFAERAARWGLTARRSSTDDDDAGDADDAGDDTGDESE